MITRENNNQSSHQFIASYLSAATASIIQTIMTQPVDTAAKKIQKNNDKTKSLYNIIYPNKNSSLWSGLSAAISYRVVVSTMTFGSQPVVRQQIDKYYGADIVKFAGEKNKALVEQILAASIFAPLEVLFLPMDLLKVLKQVDNKTPLKILMKQDMRRLYAGASVTYFRNASAFPVLFGVSHVANQYFSNTSQNESISFYQRLMTSSAGAVAAVLVSNPADAIKTRIQAETHEPTNTKKIFARDIAKQIYHQKGLMGFFAGTSFRLMAIAPRLTLIKSLSEQMTPWMSDQIDSIARSFKK